MRFDGVLADRHTTEDGSEYLHITFNRGREPAAVIDAEFLFLTGDGVALPRHSEFSGCILRLFLQPKCAMTFDCCIQRMTGNNLIHGESEFALLVTTFAGVSLVECLRRESFVRCLV